MQKLGRRGAWLLFVTLLLLTGSAGALAADEVEFRLDLPVGMTIVSEQNIDFDIRIDIPDSPLSLPVSVRAVLEEAFDHVNDDGLIPYATRFVNFELLIDGAPLPGFPSGQEFAELLGGTLIYLDRNGMPVLFPERDYDDAMDPLEAYFLNALGGFSYLPDKPVRVGESWTRDVQIDLPVDDVTTITLALSGEFTLVDTWPEAELAIIEFSTTVRVEAPLPLEPDFTVSISAVAHDRGRMAVHVGSGLTLYKSSGGQAVIRFEPDQGALFDLEELDEIPLKELAEGFVIVIDAREELVVTDIREHDEFPPFPITELVPPGAGSFDFFFDLDGVLLDGDEAAEVQLVFGPPAGKSLLYEITTRQHVITTSTASSETLDVEVRMRMDVQFGEADADGNHPFSVEVVDGGFRVPPWPELPLPELGLTVSGRISPDLEVVDIVGPEEFDIEMFRNLLSITAEMGVPNEGWVGIGESWTTEMTFPLDEGLGTLVVPVHFTVRHIDTAAGAVTIDYSFEVIQEVETETGMAANPAGLLVLEMKGVGQVTVDLALGSVRRDIVRTESFVYVFSGPSYDFIRANPDLEPDAVIHEVTDIRIELLEVRDLPAAE